MTEATKTVKEQALQNLEAGHKPLEQLLATLTAEQMTTPGVYADGQGDWTVKDILAHITWWEQSVFGWLGLPFAVPRSPMPEGKLEEDEENNYIFLGNKDRSLDDVLHSFNYSYQQLVQAIQDTSEEQLNQPRKGTPDGPPVWKILDGNTYEHYTIHYQSIREWLDKQNAA